MIGCSYSEVMSLPYDELLGWFEYFDRRPYGWREDNRAATIALSFGGGDKIKPSDLFPSLGAIQRGTSAKEPDAARVGRKFMERFSSKFTEPSEHLK